jgi:uridylate kinase
MRIAIKVGGSVFCPTDRPDPEFVRGLAQTLLELSANHSMLVVVGGGRLARLMIRHGKEKGMSADELHTLGIDAARMNAAFLVSKLGENVFRGIPKSVDEVKEAFASNKIVVVGGFKPGQTTDAVTAQSAQAIGADLIIIGTDVRGVYDKDPKKHDDAKFIGKISAADLGHLVEKEVIAPGEKTIVDPIAAQIIEKTGIKTIVLDVSDSDNIVKAIEGKEFVGTTIG